MLLGLRAKLRSGNPDFEGLSGEVRDLANEVGRKSLFRNYEPGEPTPTANRTASEIGTHLCDVLEALRLQRVTAAMCAVDAALLALG